MHVQSFSIVFVEGGMLIRIKTKTSSFKTVEGDRFENFL